VYTTPSKIIEFQMTLSDKRKTLLKIEYPIGIINLMTDEDVEDVIRKTNNYKERKQYTVQL